MEWGPPFRRKRGGGQSANHGQCQQNAEQLSCLSHFFFPSFWFLWGARQNDAESSFLRLEWLYSGNAPVLSISSRPPSVYGTVPPPPVAGSRFCGVEVTPKTSMWEKGAANGPFRLSKARSPQHLFSHTHPRNQEADTLFLFFPSVGLAQLSKKSIPGTEEII